MYDATSSKMFNIFTPFSGSVCFTTHPSKNEIFKCRFLHFFESNFKIWLKEKIAVDNIFHLVYSLCFYSKNQLNYNQFSEDSENAKKTSVLKGLNFALVAFRRARPEILAFHWGCAPMTNSWAFRMRSFFSSEHLIFLISCSAAKVTIVVLIMALAVTATVGTTRWLNL